MSNSCQLTGMLPQAYSAPAPRLPFINLKIAECHGANKTATGAGGLSDQPSNTSLRVPGPGSPTPPQAHKSNQHTARLDAAVSASGRLCCGTASAMRSRASQGTRQAERAAAHSGRGPPECKVQPSSHGRSRRPHPQHNPINTGSAHAWAMHETLF